MSAAVLAVLAAVVVAVLLNRDDPPPGAAVPAACAVAATVRGKASTAPGSLPAAITEPKPGWTFASGAAYRVTLPDGWTRTDDGQGGDCYADGSGPRWFDVAELPGLDTDAVGYLRGREAALTGGGRYVTEALDKRDNILKDAAVWEFTFQDGGRSLHAAVTVWVKPNARTYLMLWCTTEAAWHDSLSDMGLAVFTLQGAE